ncbi:unnamed protein product [Cladocopium goreaui]|uniref:RAP domain-containing protein n=1 Tax=Cladocopium goreaui TaxID=2562237 RepID=A0A9P1C122_9DINO|nr:unnamed protein product [Cladocopium goreaui]
MPSYARLSLLVSDEARVHLALLMSSLSLREPPEVLQEVAVQLEHCASDLPAPGLVGAVVALSQLGPWPFEPPPGGPLINALEGCVLELPPGQLSGLALSAATLQHEMPVFWQQVHGGLLACAKDLSPRQMADVFLALATHQMCPVTLLEELHSRLPVELHELHADEALTIAWAMVAMRFSKSGHLLPLLDLALAAKDSFTVQEIHQLQQIILSLEQEVSGSAPKRFDPWLMEELSHGQVAEAILEEVCTHLEEEGVPYSLNETVEDFYHLDLAVQGEAVLVLDATTLSTAEAPRSAWITLKCRHLKHLGWHVEWLPLRRWEVMEKEVTKRGGMWRSCPRPSDWLLYSRELGKPKDFYIVAQQEFDQNYRIISSSLA